MSKSNRSESSRSEHKPARELYVWVSLDSKAKIVVFLYVLQNRLDHATKV